ncbi:hypothetical protein MLD38_006733 [Melastoma candidum]|uniref:Uncharacterized protein n=1 Tax=Melastoma candidum TaxID=119954 RepID=A0ACB9RRU4_9MYRT|nr:hypothetical protein MLD38_006733 [Melastoma candidum]
MLAKLPEGISFIFMAILPNMYMSFGMESGTRTLVKGEGELMPESATLARPSPQSDVDLIVEVTTFNHSPRIRNNNQGQQEDERTTMQLAALHLLLFLPHHFRT